ncbi:MAG: AI-2E family transporter [Desulfarculaceae bacterium]|nr:AI-2E family transporter [Desulfarculaceae bacterium]MCF8072225.1 AI-2E family transporter [Desulfarculaceae bacterium]MCF8100146.1 AI-2E family transporter [Desulfarculaceae bacterium]MCF8117205.1 AI-2E family transporter [Desulfarculaceae bacterium]
MDHDPPNQFFPTATSRWFFGICTLLILYAAYLLVMPFLMPIFLAVVVAVMGWPLHKGVLKVVGHQRQVLAAAISVLLFALIIVLPLYFILGVITSQALDLADTVNRMMESGELQKTVQQGMGLLNPLLERVQDALHLEKTDILTQVGQLVGRISNFLYANLAGLLKGVTNLVIDFFLMLIVAFYLLIDGRHAVDRLLDLSPMPVSLNNQIKDEVLTTMRATLTGTVVLALLQGFLGGVGFWTFGVPNSPFWGTLMVFASVVPIVGTAMVWVPGGLYLLIIGHTGPAIGMMAWCLVAALVCDNFLRPKLIGGLGGLHPLLVFFAVLGGLLMFGVIGLVLGPMVLALSLSLLEVYRLHFVDHHDASNPGPDSKAEAESQAEQA